MSTSSGIRRPSLVQVATVRNKMDSARTGSTGYESSNLKSCALLRPQHHKPASQTPIRKIVPTLKTLEVCFYADQCCSYFYLNVQAPNIIRHFDDSQSYHHLSLLYRSRHNHSLVKDDQLQLASRMKRKSSFSLRIATKHPLALYNLIVLQLCFADIQNQYGIEEHLT